MLIIAKRSKGSTKSSPKSTERDAFKAFDFNPISNKYVYSLVTIGDPFLNSSKIRSITSFKKEYIPLKFCSLYHEIASLLLNKFLNLVAQVSF